MAIYLDGVKIAGFGGRPGEGVPTGGTAGQVLAKKSGTDYDTEWVNQSASGDMLASVYDPQNKAQDIFAYVDNAIQTAVTSSWGASY